MEICDFASSSPWASICERDRQGSAKFSADSSFKGKPSDHTPDGNIVDSEPAADKESVHHNFKSLPQRRFVQGQTNTLQIKTIREGYNSGRTYFLRSNTDADCQLLIEKLSRLAKIARSKAEVRSQLEMVQLKLRTFYNSTSFQAVTVLLITAVWRS
jgi:hypothetical protein